MPKVAGTKGNPATKRMANEARKRRRQRCWERGKERHEVTRLAGEARAKANAKARKDNPGYLTPWEVARMTRASRRVALQR